MLKQQEACIKLLPHSNQAYSFYHNIFKPHLSELAEEYCTNPTFLTKLFVLTFINYVGGQISRNALIEQHLRSDPLVFDRYIVHLKKQKLLTEQKLPEQSSEKTFLILSEQGKAFIKRCQFSDFLTLEREKNRFKESWLKPLEKTIEVTYELKKHSKQLARLTDSYYETIARQTKLWLGLKDFLVKAVGLDLRNQQEKDFWQHPLIHKKLFNLWMNNIGQYSPKGESHERTQFLKQIRKLLHYARNPKQGDIQRNYESTRRDLRINRSENFAFIAFLMTYDSRPYKDVFAEHFKLAVVTKKYEFLLRRLANYNTMVHFPALGERFPFDSRLDYSPLMIPLNPKYTFPIRLPPTQTRQSNIYVSIPVTADEHEAQRKNAQVAGLKKQVKDYEEKNLFLEADLKNIEIGEDGHIYRKQAKSVTSVKKPKNEQEKRLPFKGYGRNRGNYLKDQVLLAFHKTNPAAGKSGLVLHFNLRDPILLLLEGLDRDFPMHLDELCYVLKALDLYQEALSDTKNESKIQANQALNEKRQAKKSLQVCADCIENIIDWLFNPEEAIYAEEILSESRDKFLKKLERIRREYFDVHAGTVNPHGEQSAWKYINNRIVENQEPELLTAIVERFSNTCFDMMINLQSLLTGQELLLKEGDASISSSDKNTIAEHHMTLMDILEHHLQELLHDVFTKSIDISAMTKDKRSEPLLAEIIVEGCLKLSQDGELEARLVTHLEEHYKAHYDFLKNIVYSGDEYLDSNLPEVQEIYQFTYVDNYLAEKVQKSVDDIIGLIKRTRSRLFSREQSNRLLCFIDPDSVEIMIGDFAYGGEEFNVQAKILSETRKGEQHLTELKERTAEIKQETEYQMELKRQEIAQHNAQIELKIKTAVLDSNYTEAMNLSMFSDGEAAKNMQVLMKKSPDLLSLLTLGNPDTYKIVETQKTKRQILTMLEKNKDLLDKLDPTALAILLDQNPTQSLDIETYRQTLKAVTDALRREPYPAQAHMIIDSNTPN